MPTLLKLMLRSSPGLLGAFALVAACSGTGAGESNVGTGGSGASASGGTSGSGTGGTSGSGTGGFGAVSGSSSGGSGGIPDGGACNAISATATKSAANLLVVLDLSGSMQSYVPPLGTRWSATRAAFLSVLPNLPAELRMGVVYFGHPTGTPGCTASDPGCCTRNSANGGADIPIQPLTNQQKATITNWMNATSSSNNNNTPTHDALAGAYDILDHSGLDGNYYALLITDGAENCGGDSQATIALAGSAATGSPSIKTFVVGSPGSDGYRQTLSDIAKAGETPRTPTCNGSAGNTCHYDLSTSSNFQADLTNALTAILGQTTLPCVFDIPSQDGGAFDSTKVNVKYTNGSGASADVLWDQDCKSASQQGWEYSPDKKQILLCKSICDVVKQDAGGKIDILFGCPTVSIN